MDTDLVEQRSNDSVGLVEQAGQQVHIADLRVAGFGRQGLCSGERFLGFDGEFFDAKAH
jgi:hypothetical protein